MGLHYQHTEPAERRRLPLAILLGFILGCLLTATLLTTWQDTQGDTFALDRSEYTIIPAEDGSCGRINR